MNDPAPGPRARSAPELKAQIEAERLGRPFLVYRDGDDEQRLLVIEEGVEALWVGRSDSADPTSAGTGRSQACTQSSSWWGSSARWSTTGSRATARS